jgi:hypothetical protein
MSFVAFSHIGGTVGKSVSRVGGKTQARKGRLRRGSTDDKIGCNYGYLVQLSQRTLILSPTSTLFHSHCGEARKLPSPTFSRGRRPFITLSHIQLWERAG